VNENDFLPSWKRLTATEQMLPRLCKEGLNSVLAEYLEFFESDVDSMDPKLFDRLLQLMALLKQSMMLEGRTNQSVAGIDARELHERDPFLSRRIFNDDDFLPIPKRDCSGMQGLVREIAEISSETVRGAAALPDTRRLEQRTSSRQLQGEQTKAAAAEMAVKYNIRSVDAHEHLFTKLQTMRDSFLARRIYTPSTIPRLSTGWKAKRHNLQAVATKLWSLEEPLREIARDQVLLGAVEHVDNWGHFSGLVAALFALAKIFQTAAEIEGKTGNRPHPPWTIKAANLCKTFWRKQMQKEPTPHFTEHTITQPNNEFSRWFCELMDLVAELTASECSTILKNAN
jgi:hypothetical protein